MSGAVTCPSGPIQRCRQQRLFLKEGRLHYVHNYLKVQEFLVASSTPVPVGRHTLGVSFTPTGKFLKPDYSTVDVALYVDGETVGELKGIRVAAMYSAMTGYGLLVGRNSGTSVSREYAVPFTFTGGLEKVVIDLSGDHIPDHEAGIRIALHQD